MTAGNALVQSVGLRVLRVRDLIGIAGLAGCALLAAAAVLLALAWRQHRTDLTSLRPVSPEPSTTTSAVQPADAAAPRVRLPSAYDVPLLLARIERVALDQGLGWPKADYQVNAATGEMPASLEVRCTLKGGYPSIRQFIAVLLRDQPTLTLREFSVTRLNIEAKDVEARMTLLVYMTDSAVYTPENPR